MALVAAAAGLLAQSAVPPGVRVAPPVGSAPAQDPVIVPKPDAPAVPFDEWLQALRQDALARGISQRTIDAALTGIEPLPVVVDRDRTQAEQTLTFDQYLKRRLTARFLATARAMARTNAKLLRKVSAAYGVSSSTLVAIWGVESNFGRFTGTWPTIQALATLAYDPHRPTLFRSELFAALQILDRQEIDLESLKGSWAGAMGQPQFMPTNYLRYAVDFDGDSRRDIWSSTPDVLASMANYLKDHGWVSGFRWGREVAIPEAAASKVASAVPLRVTGACQAIRQLTEPRALGDWSALGVTQPDGSPLPGKTLTASLLRVDTHTFLVYRNYEVLLGYNCAHSYALTVGMLADSIGGN